MMPEPSVWRVRIRSAIVFNVSFFFPDLTTVYFKFVRLNDDEYLCIAPERHRVQISRSVNQGGCILKKCK
jgi:hypothetical protein